MSTSPTATIADWEDFPVALRQIVDDLSDFAVPDRPARHIAADAVAALVGRLEGTLRAEVETSPRHGAGSAPADLVQAVESASHRLTDAKGDLENMVKRDRLARYDAIRDLTEALVDLNGGLDRRRATANPPAPPRHGAASPSPSR